jgi:hypothetical protein
VVGWVSKIHFNFWNVMEYSLGFFGGAGLCYGVLTGQWEKEEQTRLPAKQIFHISMIALIIPFIIWQQRFEWKKIEETYSHLSKNDTTHIISLIRWGTLMLIVGVAAYWINRYKQKGMSELLEIQRFFYSHWLLYTLLSLIITGAFISIYRIEQYLYLVNYLIVIALIGKLTPDFQPTELKVSHSIKLFGVIIGILGIAAWIAIQIH